MDHEDKYLYSKFNLAKYYDNYYDEILASHVYTDKKKANELYLKYFYQSILEDEDLGTPLAYFLIKYPRSWNQVVDWLNNNVYDIYDLLYAYMIVVYFEEIGGKVEICLRNAIMFSTKNDNHVIDAGMKLWCYIDKSQLKDEDYLTDLIDLVYQYAEVEDNKISEYDHFIPDIINKLNQVYGSLNDMEIYYFQQSSTYQRSRILIFTRALQKLEQFFIDNGRKP